MSDELQAAQIARPVRPLDLDDTIARAAEVMRTTGLSVVPVIDGGRLVGGVSEQALTRALLSAPSEAPAWTLDRVLGDGLRVIPGSTPVSEALQILSDGSAGVGVVSDWDGSCRGVITRADLVSAWGTGLRPPRIGGMATPIGVYLTGGGVQAGAGNLGLVLTGVTLWFFFLGTVWGLDSLMAIAQQVTGLPLLAAMGSTNAGTLSWLDLLPSLYQGAMALGIVLILRMSPLAGYHAAEHQTVWAMEQGEPLTPERVARMPRPHPRCGTNIMVALSIYLILEPISSLLALVSCLIAWRYLGYYAQLYLTTRPASQKQLASGVRAGRELLERYQQRLRSGRGVRLAEQIWNMGILQVLAGFWGWHLLCSALLSSLGLQLPLEL